jgi:hypothetical protein
MFDDATRCMTPTEETATSARALDWRSLYLDCYEATEKAYARLGHMLGFNPPIVSSVRAFEATPRILLLGLNPAGSRDYPEHRGQFRYEESDGYLGTSWDDYPPGQAPLQRQVAQLLRYLQRRIAERDPLEVFARNRVVAGSLVPFRSPSEDTLHNPAASLAFGRSMWRDIFGHWRPQYAVCFGGTPFRELTSLLGTVTEARDYDPRWQGRLRLRVFADGTRLLALPHMSRFPIFGRAASAPAIEAAFCDLLAPSFRRDIAA